MTDISLGFLADRDDDGTLRPRALASAKFLDPSSVSEGMIAEWDKQAAEWRSSPAGPDILEDVKAMISTLQADTLFGPWSVTLPARLIRDRRIARRVTRRTGVRFITDRARTPRGYYVIDFDRSSK